MFGKGAKVSGSKNGMYGKKREKNPAWNGGRHQRKDGYWRVLVDGKRILEHRHVLIEAGHNLDGLIVHHKNRDKSDNNLENLVVMSQSEHINEHRSELQNGASF